MSTILKGLNPLDTSTGCFFLNGVEQKDTPLSEIIKESWQNNFNNRSFKESIKSTYQALVGDHQSIFISNADSTVLVDCNLKTFKGVLDFLIIPLIARQLWNWSSLQMNNDQRSFSMDLAITAAREFSLAVSAARILIGIALTIALTPIVGLICLLRKPNEQNHQTNNDYISEELSNLGALNRV